MALYERTHNQSFNTAWPYRPCSDLSRVAASAGLTRRYELKEI